MRGQGPSLRAAHQGGQFDLGHLVGRVAEGSVIAHLQRRRADEGEDGAGQAATDADPPDAERRGTSQGAWICAAVEQNVLPVDVAGPGAA